MDLSIAEVPAKSPCDRDSLLAHYASVRSLTRQLCEPLATEDHGVQSMPDASPTKWHLAHTTWFFETFVLAVANPDHRPFHPAYGYLFNSYYNAIGQRVARHQRGLLTRPLVSEIYQYRWCVDEQMRRFVEQAAADRLSAFAERIVLGLNHEQQHQELMLTDIKHAFASNPLRPAYQDRLPPADGAAPPLRWLSYPAGVRWIGHGQDGFAFDNEGPRHRQFVEAFQLGSRLITNREFQEFIDDNGYQRPELWLADGWDTRRSQDWQAPLYWEMGADGWRVMTLGGMKDVAADEPVCHVSFYEADAFARWAGARLPTEFEWEAAAADQPVAGNLLDCGRLQPALAATTATPAQLFGDAWEWTGSPYIAYPGFRPAAGALGEYNGKFMCNQMVLRGGSCVTPSSHLRSSYRNFFPPAARWQFTGIRLAKDL